MLYAIDLENATYFWNDVGEEKEFLEEVKESDLNYEFIYEGDREDNIANFKSIEEADGFIKRMKKEKEENGKTYLICYVDKDGTQWARLIYKSEIKNLDIDYIEVLTEFGNVSKIKDC